MSLNPSSVKNLSNECKKKVKQTPFMQIFCKIRTERVCQKYVCAAVTGKVNRRFKADAQANSGQKKALCKLELFVQLYKVLFAKF